MLGVPEGESSVHLVAIPAAVAALGQVAGLLEIVDGLGCRAPRVTSRLPLFRPPTDDEGRLST
jgi:hypothetical protein